MKRAGKIDPDAGLAAIKPLLAVQDALEIVQDRQDLLLIRQLRADLKSMLTADDRQSADWALSEVSAILKTVVEFVGNVIDEETTTNDGQVLFLQEQVTRVLSDLLKCLEDIPKGTLDKRLISEKRTSGYSTLELDFVEMLVTTVPIIQNVEDSKRKPQDPKTTLAQARVIFAKRLKAHGIKFRGEPITAEKLLNLKTMPPSKRRVK